MQMLFLLLLHITQKLKEPNNNSLPDFNSDIFNLIMKSYQFNNHQSRRRRGNLPPGPY